MKFEGYTVKVDHRNKSPIKSQWVVSEWDELRIFLDAKRNGWFCSKKNSFWSLDCVNASLAKLGTHAKDGDLYLARYVVNQNLWHGYPIASEQADIPPSRILNMWVESNIMTKAKANKILKGNS